MLCLAGCLAACVTAVSATAARPASGQPATRVMTCNVRITGLPEDETAGRRWEDRRDACLKAIRMYRPDVICMQEVIYDSYNYFKEKFSDYVAYGFAGPEMDPYTEGYHFIGKNVIFFSKKRYEFVSSGCYWLSETPLAAAAVRGTRCAPATATGCACATGRAVRSSACWTSTSTTSRTMRGASR